MTVALVKSQVGSTAAAGAATARINGVAANDTLLSFAIQADGTTPGVPADSSGDPFVAITDMLHGNGTLCYLLSYVLRSAGGNETTSSSMTGPSELVVAELSGVATPQSSLNARGVTVWNPAIPDGILRGQVQNATAAGGTLYPANAKGGLGFALLVASAGAITCTSPSWTLASSGSALGMVYDLRMIQYPGPGNIDIAWTTSTPGDLMVLVFGMPAA